MLLLLVYSVGLLLYFQWISAVALVWDNHAPLIWIYQMDNNMVNNNYFLSFWPATLNIQL